MERYYQYNTDYYYTGYTDADIPILSSTIIEPETVNHIIWNHSANVWEIESTPTQTLEEIQKEEIINCHQFFDDIIDNVFSGLASFEPQTFATQEEEWRLWNEDNTASTPYVDILCTRRNIDKTTLMGKIGTNVMGYADAQGNMHALEDAILSATDIPTLEYIKANVLPWYAT